MAASGFWGSIQQGIYSMLEYDTLKTVHIRSKKVGLIFRLLQITILAYVVGYGIIYQKGYQEVDSAVSTVLTKVKGIAITCDNTDISSMNDCVPGDLRVWDTPDYIKPAQENDAFFVVSNSIQTSKQTQRAEGWDEDPAAPVTGSASAFNCTSDADCPRFATSRNGALTGECNTTTERCRIYGWGPVESKDEDDRATTDGLFYARHMPAVKNFTVYIKNTVFFQRFGAKFGSTDESDKVDVYTCTWSPTGLERHCPIFKIDTILNEAGITDFENQAMRNGALITIQVNYDCNLDSSAHTCSPTYKFTRLDTKSDLSAGYNFRFANYQIDPPARDLYKVYGLRFVFVVSGTAGRFSMVPLLVALGSGLGLLGLATVIADLLVTKCIRNANVYYGLKYQVVDEEDIDRAGIDHIPIGDQKLERQPLLP
ncbi:uncharacterized protein MONBRDRAFT_31366 [Monosiga brevicollis MX1]|uniref:Uncharacterized protein n=1 Tax=Monosiga brevicollis TaxID=81824 RepID=A9URI5_MONBE|nr:uncharacterized protein MONBRDRAFT_31366 [Monosiga brevicollis MX1]EDQ92249.1 predicted protein [Monosiga brevicollis MX1]|eukprot:XP_001743535.1 hypothetical protein [Monosiga brevicollis MX1]